MNEENNAVEIKDEQLQQVSGGEGITRNCFTLAPGGWADYPNPMDCYHCERYKSCRNVHKAPPAGTFA